MLLRCEGNFIYLGKNPIQLLGLKCQFILGIAGSFEEIEQTLSLAFDTKRQVSAAVPAEHPQLSA